MSSEEDIVGGEPINLSREARKSLHIEEDTPITPELLNQKCENLSILNQINITNSDVNILSNYIDSSNVNVCCEGKRIFFQGDMDKFINNVKTSRQPALSLKELMAVSERLIQLSDNMQLKLKISQTELTQLTLEGFKKLIECHNITQCAFDIENLKEFNEEYLKKLEEILNTIKLELFYDGDYPTSQREEGFLESLSILKKCVNISTVDFNIHDINSLLEDAFIDDDKVNYHITIQDYINSEKRLTEIMKESKGSWRLDIQDISELNKGNTDAYRQFLADDEEGNHKLGIYLGRFRLVPTNCIREAVAMNKDIDINAFTMMLPNIVRLSEEEEEKVYKILEKNPDLNLWFTTDNENTYEFKQTEGSKPKSFNAIRQCLNIKKKFIITNIGTLNIDDLEGFDLYYYGDCISPEKSIGTVKAIKEKVKKLTKDLKEKDDFTKVATVCKRLAKGITYDYEASDLIDKENKKEELSENEKEQTANSQNLTGLLTGKTVCGGYSQILNCLLTTLGVECRCITGYRQSEIEGEEAKGHTWVQVKIDQEWYNLDLTWCRNNIRKGEMPEYFLLSDKEFKHGKYEITTENIEECPKSYSRERVEKFFTEYQVINTHTYHKAVRAQMSDNILSKQYMRGPDR